MKHYFLSERVGTGGGDFAAALLAKGRGMLFPLLVDERLYVICRQPPRIQRHTSCLQTLVQTANALAALLAKSCGAACVASPPAALAPWAIVPRTSGDWEAGHMYFWNSFIDCLFGSVTARGAPQGRSLVTPGPLQVDGCICFRVYIGC